MIEKMDVYLSDEDRETLEAFKALKNYDDTMAINVLLGFGLDVAKTIIKKAGPQ